MDKGRSMANFIAKCKFCERKGSISFIDTHPYLMEKNEEPQKFASFECRGWDIIDFVPKSGFYCRSTESDTEFKDVDMTDRDWAEYDDEGDVAVGIYDMKTVIE